MSTIQDLEDSVSRPQTKAVPAEILEDPLLKKMSTCLPRHYDFLLPRTIYKLRKTKSKRVALQFPEGLLMYSGVISDILERLAGVETVIMGDVTYGACCIDDYTSRSLGCDFLIHYGHTCLVPIDSSDMRVMYVPVSIEVDVAHLASVLREALPADHRLLVAATVQFVSSVQKQLPELRKHFKAVSIPQIDPLAPGEVLGCTAPTLCDTDAIINVADGRFHLESLMIANPLIKAFSYDPYSKKLMSESYDTARLATSRRAAIEKAKSAHTWGLILGTLGHQGSPRIIKRLQTLLSAQNKPFVTVLMSEITADRLALFTDVQAWVQAACPRLSMDWGDSFPQPLLSPYEAEVALGATAWKPAYPMDNWAKAGGPWSNYGAGKKLGMAAARAAPTAEC